MEVLRKRDHIKEEEDKRELSLDQAKGNFDNFPISAKSKANLISKNIHYLFPIQFNTFMSIYEGHDLIGRDRTGSGKTLAFSLPILERLRERGNVFVNNKGQSPLIIVLVPTRELVMQVTKEFIRFMNFENEYRVLSVYGGVDIFPQMDALRNGVEIIVGTPGRLIDLMDRRAFSFRNIQHFILDETDQMLNIGFQEDIERILKTVRQTMEENQKSIESVQFLLFSATVPNWVDQISAKFMKPDYVYVDMIKHSETKTSKTVEHLALFFPSKDHKIEAIGDLVLVYGGAHSRTIIFTDTKEEANEVLLKGQLKVECQVLHGDIPQKQREVTFTSFRNGSLKCLAATNVAARGLDIPEVDLIVQLSPPKSVEDYIHRSGRTGRAGKVGVCITFFTKRQQENMTKIERDAKIKFTKIGAPQPSDIMRSNARDVSCSFDNVSKDVLVYFQDNVKSILAKYTPDEAISRALAVITGYTKSVQQRSLLCSVEGFVTYQMEVDYEVKSPSFFWNLLRKNCASTITDNIKSMRFLKSHKGVVFDLREEDRKLFDEIISNMDMKNMTLEVAKVLPEIEERNDFSTGYGNNGYGNGGYGGYSNNGYGNNGYGNSGYGNSYGNGGYGGNNGYQKSGYGGGRTNDNPRIFDRFGSNNGGDRRNGDYRANDSQPRTGGKDDCKLFVGNIPFDFKESDLMDLCRNKGIKPIDVFMGKTPEGNNKGFGLMKFADPKTAKDAIAELSSVRLGNRSLRVDYADKK